MRKVLILAYDFPPYNSIGAQRPYSWYRYFSKSGWYPIVVCNNPRNIDRDESYPLFDEETGRVIYVSLKHINYKHVIFRKIHTFFKLIFGFFIKNTDHRIGLYKEVRNLLSREKVDLIIATGEPFILFTYAAQLSKEFNTPWTADYRDGWSTNYTELFESGIFTKIYYNYLKFIEKRTLKNVSLITTTCNSQKEELIRIHPHAKVEIILNGFFEDIIQKINKKQNKDTFTIVYGGTIYPFHKLEIFLSGFRRFINEIQTKNVVVKFVGANFYGRQISRILEFDRPLSKYFEIIDRLPLNEALEKISEANLLLLLGHPQIKQLYAKVFDYIALNRKILFVVSDHSNIAEILDKTNTGLICENEEDVFNYLKSTYNEFIEKGFVHCQAENLNYYTREYQAQSMVKLLNSITK